MVSAIGSPLVLTSVTLVDGTLRDVYIADGVITAVMAPGLPHLDGLDYVIVDLVGHVLLPAPAEPHAHLDRALLADRMTKPSSDLSGAIDEIRAIYPSMSASDISRRALIAVTEAAAKGFTAIRTHSGCGPTLGIRSVEVLVELRDSLRDVMDIQVVALAEPGLTGVGGRANRQTLADAMAVGADLVGGSPSIDEDPRAAVKELLAIARDVGRGIDLHVDETVVPGILVLKYLAEQVLETGFDLPVTASHCVSLGMQDAVVAREVCAAVAAANIAVIALPQTNLFLQGRSTSTCKPRGLTALTDLLEAGVCVAGGGDNWRDPFNPMGRIDPLETASLLVTAGHLTPESAYSCVSNQARAILGLTKVQLEPGSTADLLAVRASSLTDAVAGASEDRLVIRAGRILARTTVHRGWDRRLLRADMNETLHMAFTI
jgi:cytosine deaminase